MKGGVYKIIVSETREICTLPKGLFPRHPGGRGAYGSFSCNLGKNSQEYPCVKKVSSMETCHFILYSKI